MLDLTPEQYYEFVKAKTPNQIRDARLDLPHSTTEQIQEERSLAINEQARRRNLPNEFMECPRCKGFHGMLKNTDGLCDQCDMTIQPYRYDLAHGLINKDFASKSHK